MTAPDDTEQPPTATTRLEVAGMDCAEEVALVERALTSLPDVREVRVNLVGGHVQVAHHPSLEPKVLIERLAKSGLKASRASEGPETSSRIVPRARLFSVLLSGILTGLGLVLGWMEAGPTWMRITILAVAIVSGGWFIAPKALGAVRRLSLDMNVLMTVAVLGAAAIGEWGEAAAVVFLFALSELLESLSVARARRSIRSLMDLAPETAWIKEGASLRELPVREVSKGDIILVRAGARVPLDGEVEDGTSSVNEAPITGESMPVAKQAGDTVFAGSINGQGSLEVRVTHPASDTMLARIIHLVEEAQSQRAPLQRSVDVFARIYTPAVMILALAIWLVPPLVMDGAWQAWTYRALVLLVIACPCALVISTPVSVVSGLTALARQGVLIKGGAFLEAVGKLRALAVDKTGTITLGQPEVMEVMPQEARSASEVLRLAASIDTHSQHPLAQAVVARARTENLQLSPAIHYQARSGRGATAEVDGQGCFVGNPRLVRELGLASADLEETIRTQESQARSVVAVGLMPRDDGAGEVLGLIAVGDAIRPNARDAIRRIHDAGVQRVVMLSGDNQQTVDTVARQAGIDEAHGQLLPDQKVEQVRRMVARHRFVGMIGDGVNDAPAMAAASVGIAMGAAGTDTALETADMALMQDDLDKVADAIRLGRRTVRIIRANITFALAIKALFLVLALTGHTSLWLAILADTGATLLVVANALRLLRDP